MIFSLLTHPSNISTFQHFITFQHFMGGSNISTFQHFNISWAVPTFQHFNILRTHSADAPPISHFNISTFHNSSPTSHGLTRRRPDLRYATPATPPSTLSGPPLLRSIYGMSFSSSLGFVLFERFRVCVFERFRVCFVRAV